MRHAWLFGGLMRFTWAAGESGIGYPHLSIWGTPASAHPASLNLALADGSVRPLSRASSREVLLAIAGMADGEVLPPID